MLENGTDFHVFHMGKSKKRKISRAKRGQGALMHDVQEALDEAGQQLGADHNKKLVPVIVTYKKKKRNSWKTWKM